jgi:hypothetical protein
MLKEKFSASFRMWHSMAVQGQSTRLKQHGLTFSTDNSLVMQMPIDDYNV